MIRFFSFKSLIYDLYLMVECRHETQVQSIFQNNPINIHTLLWFVSSKLQIYWCNFYLIFYLKSIFFNLLQDDSVRPNFSTYVSFILSYLNSSENRKVTQAMRTFCDYVLIESANKSISIVEGVCSFLIIIFSHLLTVFKLYNHYILVRGSNNQDDQYLQHFYLWSTFVRFCV